MSASKTIVPHIERRRFWRIAGAGAAFQAGAAAIDSATILASLFPDDLPEAFRTSHASCS